MSGSTRSKLMYASYLSLPQVKEYLIFLLETEMMTFDEKTLLYKPTENGIKFLHIYPEMIELFSRHIPGRDGSLGFISI